MKLIKSPVEGRFIDRAFNFVCSIGVNEVYEFGLLLAKNIRICRRVSNGGRMRRELNGKWT